MNQATSNPIDENVCDLSYLNEMMGGKKHLILEIMETFLSQIPDELKSMNEAISNIKYSAIKNLAHTMKSSVSIMGIEILRPVLQEMENLGGMETNLEKITKLNIQLNSICKQAINEIIRKKSYYNLA